MIALLALIGAATALHAQEPVLLRGRVIGSDSLPRAGVLVQALAEQGDTSVARVATSATGDFAFRTTRPRIRIRVLAVGYAPLDAGVFPVAAGAAPIVIVHSPQPVRLEAVVSQARAVCRPSPMGTQPAALLLAEAQKALVLASTATQSAPPNARYALLSWQAEPDGSPRGARSVRIASGASLRPFQSVPPVVIQQEGWVVEEPDGTLYRAPDASLLASEQFAREHCFRVETAATPDAPLVGVTFEPASRRRVAQLRGTLWLDSRTYELQRVDFAYVNVPREVETSRAGGSIHLTRLPNGLWFEERWELRMPRLLEQRNTAGATRGGGLATRVVESLQVLGGQVLELRLGDELLYASAEAGLETAVAQGSDSVALADTLFGPSSCREELGAEPTSRVLGDVHPARSADEAPRVTLEWREQFRVGAAHEWRWTTRVLETQARADGRFEFCGVPRQRTLQLRASVGERKAGPLTLRIAADAAVARVSVSLSDPRERQGQMRVRVVSETGDIVPHAVVTADGGAPRIADANGVVLLDAANGRAVRVLARRIGFAAADTLLSAREGSREHVVTLGPRVQTLGTVTVTATQSPLAQRGFYDRALRVQRGAMVGDFLAPEQLEARAATQTSQLLMLSRFVTLGWSREARPRRIVRGRAGCRYEVVVDGLRVNLDLTPEGDVPVDDLVSGGEVAAIEVYPSIANAPAELIPLTGGGCGLIAIWTGGRVP